MANANYKSYVTLSHPGIQFNYYKAEFMSTLTLVFYNRTYRFLSNKSTKALKHGLKVQIYNVTT